MQKWEYCYLRGNKVYVYSSNGEIESKLDIGMSKGDKHPRLIAKLGLDGWELVSIQPGFWFFKRPIED